ncbi:MAG: helix-turn-helix transcriptional regulator [Pseudohongiellaceae bacterium]
MSNRIRELRATHGNMSQLDLAQQIRVTRQTVNAIELGKYSPSLEVAFRIAELFGLPLEEVFKYEKKRGVELGG